MSWRSYRTTTVLTEMLMLTTGHPYNYFPAAAIEVHLEEGDFVSITTELQGTNDCGFNVMFAGYLKEATLHPDNDVRTGGLFLRQGMGINITPDMHHGCLSVNTHFVAQETRLYNFVAMAYAASTKAKPNDELWLHYVDMSLSTYSSNLEKRVAGLETFHPWGNFDEFRFT